MTNDNDLLLLASSQNIKPFEVYIDSNGYKTLTPQTRNYTAKYEKPYVYRHAGSTAQGLLVNEKLKKVEFPNCIKATGETDDTWGDGAFGEAFRGCTSLTSVSFPALTTATGGSGGTDSYGAFVSAFYSCTSLTSVSFPSLTTVTGGSGGTDSYGAFVSAFSHCTSLTSVSFPSLTTATGGSGGDSRGAFASAFSYCTSLTSVSFPSLTTVTGGSHFKPTFYEAFQGCSPSLKVHFKKSMKGKTGLDYKTMGLKSLDQVVFDLD